jgi:hypothetical protein
MLCFGGTILWGLLKMLGEHESNHATTTDTRRTIQMKQNAALPVPPIKF